MNTHDKYELPELPDWSRYDDLGGRVPSEIREGFQEYAREAIEPYAKRIAELEAQIEADRKRIAKIRASESCAVCGSRETELHTKCLECHAETVNYEQAKHNKTSHADRKRRGEPVLVGWAVGTTDGGLLHASKYTEEEARAAGYSLPLYRLTAPQPTEPLPDPGPSDDDLIRAAMARNKKPAKTVNNEFEAMHGDQWQKGFASACRYLGSKAEQSPAQKRRERLRSDPVKAAALDGARERIAAELADSVKPVTWTLTQQQVTALAAELITGAQALGGTNDKGVESDVRLMVLMPGTIADDDGKLNDKPILAFCLDDYPDEGVYPINPADCGEFGGRGRRIEGEEK